jgi:hypothetical protein
MRINLAKHAKYCKSENRQGLEEARPVTLKAAPFDAAEVLDTQEFIATPFETAIRRSSHGRSAPSPVHAICQGSPRRSA